MCDLGNSEHAYCISILHCTITLTVPYTMIAGAYSVYCVGVDSGGPAQHILEVNFFMIL